MGSIELVDVDKVYPDGFHAVRGLDLSVRDGEFHVLLGPSGCGKSTVLRMIAGLERATGGEIRFDGECVDELGARDRDVAMAFQQHALYPHMTVAENLGFPLKMAGVRARMIRDQVREVARMLNVDDVLDRKPSQLSGGQQQRVALGRAVIRRPRIFLMDEPLSNLDARLRVESRAAIVRLQRRLGTTTVFVTHDQVEAMALADTITVLRDGVVVQSGPPLELYHRPVDLFVAQFLGSPAMNVFAGQVAGTAGGWALRIGAQTVPLDGDPVDRSLWSNLCDRTVVVGIRPESLRRSHGGGLVASIRSCEQWGNQQVVHAVLSAVGVTARSSGSSGISVSKEREAPITAFVGSSDVLDPWEPFAMSVDADSLFLFDLDTGRSLRSPTDVARQASAMVQVT